MVLEFSSVFAWNPERTDALRIVDASERRSFGKTLHRLFVICRTPGEAACGATKPKEPASGHALQATIALDSSFFSRPGCL
jgi:hypothetical protein